MTTVGPNDYKNYARFLSDPESFYSFDKEKYFYLVDYYLDNSMKGRKKFKAICLSGAAKAENVSTTNPYHPIKIRPEFFDELLPDPCGEDFKEDPMGAKFAINMHPTALGFNPISAGQRSPGFGEELIVEYICTGPENFGKQRCLRYHFPQLSVKYDYTCANKELQSMVGQFSQTSPSNTLGNFVNQGSDRPLNETNLATDGPGMYLGYRKRRKDITHIIVHTTAGWTKAGAIRTLKRKHLSYHYLIDYDGSVEQLVDPVKYVAFHAGGVNDFSIGVSLVNVAYETNKVREKPIENNTAPWEKRIWYHPKNGRKTNKKWQPFTPEQISSWTVLMKRLVTNFKIKKENIQMHAAVSKKVKMDPGPMLPWDETLDLLYQDNGSGIM